LSSSNPTLTGGPNDLTVHVFVSYAREDKRWLDPEYRFNLVPFLKESLRRDNARFWYDKALMGGDEFKLLIESEIDKAHIALLIVSQHFLNSEFIETFELPRIAARAERKEMVVIPVLVEPCAWNDYPFLADRQMVPSSSPLIHFTESEARWADVRFEILDGLRRQVKRTRGETQAESLRKETEQERLKRENKLEEEKNRKAERRAREEAERKGAKKAEPKARGVAQSIDEMRRSGSWSSFLHGYQYDLFISSTTRDVGWVQPFSDALSNDLKRITGHRVDIFSDREGLRTGDSWDDKLLHAVANSATLVPILTPAFFASDYCQEQLKRFLGGSGVSGDAAHRSRIFPVELLCPAPEGHWLARYMAKRFCGKTPSGSPIEFAPGSEKFIEALRDLAFAIAAVLPQVPPKAS